MKKQRIRRMIAAILGLSCFGIFHSLLPAQGGASVLDGVYTEDQAKRGATTYKAECAMCHNDDLTGKGQTPPLSGADFKMDWNGLSVGDLFDRIRVSMPADHPGKLTPAQNADTLAFILKSNQFPAGKKELPADGEALKQIRFESAKP